MRLSVRNLLPLVLTPLLTQCGSKSAPSTNAVTGPFDSRGNYVEDWVNEPDKWYRPITPSSKPKEKKIARQKEEDRPPAIAVVTPKPQPTPVAVKPQTTAKPKPVLAPKPKPKPKPSFVMHKVKRGDTLTALSRRYNSSIAKIKSANGISGDIIRIGQNLKIPK